MGRRGRSAAVNEPRAVSLPIRWGLHILLGTAISPLPSPNDDSIDEGVERLPALLGEAHRLWTAPEERRRLRAFGFRPAVEPGVLKRDWHSLRVRVAESWLRAAQPGLGELLYEAPSGLLLLDGQPFAPTREGVKLVRVLLELIQDYERWIEVREGREGRIARTARSPASRSRRSPYNALAETRRVQRLLHNPATRRRRSR